MATTLGSKPDSKFYTFKPLDSEFNPDCAMIALSLRMHTKQCLQMTKAQDLH